MSLRKGWVDQWAHWPASLDDLTRFRPVRDHLQRGTPAEVALQLPHAYPHTTYRRRNEKLQIGKAKTEAI